MERALGKGSSDSVFKTLRIVHKMGADVIVSNPAKFEEVIRRIFGNYAETILKAISEASSN